MYRVYELTNKEIGKITKLRWDGDTYYWDVFESQAECNKEQNRLNNIKADWEREKAAFAKSLQKNVQVMPARIGENNERM